MRPVAIILPALALLAACGKAGPLERPEGMTPVPVAYGADRPKNAEELIKPPVQAKPRRSNELLDRSEERKTDPFDVSPGVKKASFPGDPLTADPDGDADSGDSDDDGA